MKSDSGFVFSFLVLILEFESEEVKENSTHDLHLSVRKLLPQAYSRPALYSTQSFYQYIHI